MQTGPYYKICLILKALGMNEVVLRLYYIFAVYKSGAIKRHCTGYILIEI